MKSDSLAVILAVSAVSVLTLLVGAYGVRLARTTSDFYVASRAVGPRLNASAISGEYLSAASFLGVAGLVLLRGVDSLWYPVGWTAGYLMLLIFVAAPLRRSRAYTIADFADFRLESMAARRMTSGVVVLIGVLYLVPQLQGAGLTLQTLTDAPSWVGALIVASVVLANVTAGGMRSITIAQAFQYWLKLWALLIPLAWLLIRWRHDGAPHPHLHDIAWVEPMQGSNAGYLTYSLILATFLGTMGLPHVAVRFYTNRDGTTARRTTMVVLAMLSGFYLLPTLYGVLGRIYASDLIASGQTDSVVLELPRRMLGQAPGDVVSAVLAAGAFAAFLSTSSGLVVSIGGVVAQDLIGTRLEGVSAFRLAASAAAAITLAIAIATTGLAVAHAVELAFAVAASTLSPLLILGIWWRGLTAVGAMIGMALGGVLSAAAVVTVMAGIELTGWTATVVAQPALVSVPIAFAGMVIGSLATSHRKPEHLVQILVRLHTPEEVDVDRGAFHPEARSTVTSRRSTRQIRRSSQTATTHGAPLTPSGDGSAAATDM